MTAEPDLLPLPAPDYLLPLGPGHGAISMWSENTIRQIVAHATAAKDAEVEALRVEVGDYRTNGAAAVRFAPNSAYWSNELRRLFGDDARTGIEVLENQYRQELARAERLAEALRNSSDALERLAFAIRAPNEHTPQLVELAIAMRAAALAQESNDA